jgi:hypothetical protein
MNEQTFSLKPFPNTEMQPDLRISGNIMRYVNELTITYALFGDLKDVLIATSSDISPDTSTRRHALWEDTCFEFFLGIKGSPIYWEFNLSPSGHWNVYSFEDYRQGMQEEIIFTELPFTVQFPTDGLAIAVSINLDKFAPEDQIIQVGITTVIKQKDGNLSYWALAHKGEEPDFHLRNSFVIEL